MQPATDSASGRAQGRPQLVGRDAELAELRHALEQAGAGRGRLYLVSGEPGIGKTRLADETSQIAGAIGMGVHWGRCWEAGGAPAYWPWLDVLQSLSERIPDLDPALLGDGAPILAGLVPSLAQRGASALPPISGDPEQARFRLFRSVLSLVRRATSEQALLIVLEDLHAADESSLALLHFLARELRSTRICVLATFRDVEARLSAEVGEALGRLSREGTTLSLSRLARPEAERFVVERIGEVEPEVVTQLFRRTQGNPLFLAELVGLLQRQGSLDSAQQGLPLGVREVIRQRLALITPGDRELLEQAAINGDEPETKFVALAAGVGQDEVSQAMSRAVQAGLLVVVESNRHRFSHALVREVLDGDLTAERRRLLHGRAAGALEASHSERQTPHAELAHHLLQGPRESLQRAIGHAMSAAERSLAVFAHEDATLVLEKALSAVETSEPGSELAGTVLMALGRAQLRRGAVEVGHELCERAAEIARRRQSATLLAEAALAYGLEITAALINPRLIQLLQEALSVLPETDSPLRVRVTARLAAALQPHPNLAYPIGLAQQAIASARRLQQPETLLDAMFTGVSAMMDIVDPRERLPLNLEVEQLASQLNDTERLLRTQARLVFDHAELGDLAAADARIALFTRIAQEAGAERYLWRVPLFRSMRAMTHGRFEEAEAACEEARRLGQAARDPLLERTYVFHREGLLRVWERHDDLIAHDPEARRMRAALYSGPHWQNGGSAFTCVRVEDLDATRLYVELIPDGDWPLVHNPPAFMHLGEPLALVGKTEAVRRVYDLLLPAAHRCVSWGFTSFVWDGTATRVLGLLAARLGRWPEATSFFEQALQKLQELDAKPHLARTTYEYGRAWLERGDADSRQRGQALLEAAGEQARQLEMSGLVRLCERRLSTRPPARRSAPAAAAAIATATETNAGSAPPTETAGLPFSLVLEGETWSIWHAGQAFRLRDSLGLRYLARLFEQPNRGVSALELSGVAPSEFKLVDQSDAGELLDEQARRSYQARCRELTSELEEAEAFSDLGRVARLREELSALSAELSRAVGLGGRVRRAGGAAERARSAVQRRIKNALDRIREQSPALAELLERSVRTGAECMFLPEQAQPR